MSIDKLKNRDFKLVIDRSGSMTTQDCVGGQTRWKAAEESTIAIARKVSEYDPDGIDVITFNSGFKTYANVTADKVASIFQEAEPMGGTVLAPVLKTVFGDYLARKKAGTTKANGELLVVVTDGSPQDEQDVAQAIVQFTKQLDTGDDEYGIAMLQIGKDQGASKFLKKLDDDLTSMGAKHDIVDTKTFEEVENIGLTEALLAALSD